MTCKHHWTTPPECPQCCADERDVFHADNERLRADLAKAQAERDCWKTAAGTATAELLAERDKLRADVARLTAALKKINDPEWPWSNSPSARIAREALSSTASVTDLRADLQRIAETNASADYLRTLAREALDRTASAPASDRRTCQNEVQKT